MWNMKRKIRSKKICAIILLLFIVVVAGCSVHSRQMQQKLDALGNIQGKFTFAVFGDNRSGHDMYRKIVSLVMERQPDFIVNTGDQINKPGDLKEWAGFREMSKPITIPYFLTVGNHDANAKVPLSEQIYKEQVDLPGNELYYLFVAGNSLFVILDSYLENQEKRITGNQYTWLEHVFAESDKKHKFIFLHHPLYTETGKGKHAGDCLDKYPADRDRLEALFLRYNVKTVFAGHEHFYQRTAVKGITYVITGGGGAPLYATDDNGGFYHFIIVLVDGDKIHAEVIDIDGKVRDRF
jgi:3',5'-cyclic AMP phosphodiesterase CpdA